MRPIYPYPYYLLNFNRFCSGGNQALVVGSKSEKTAVAKKDDYALHSSSTRGNSTVPVNRERKPPNNAQQTISKPVVVSQSVVPAKPLGGGSVKPTLNPSQSQQQSVSHQH